MVPIKKKKKAMWPECVDTANNKDATTRTATGQDVASGQRISLWLKCHHHVHRVLGFRPQLDNPQMRKMGPWDTSLTTGIGKRELQQPDVWFPESEVHPDLCKLAKIPHDEGEVLEEAARRPLMSSQHIWHANYQGASTTYMLMHSLIKQESSLAGCIGLGKEGLRSV